MDYPKINLAVGYEVDAGWPAKPANVQWGAMPGVAVDGRGHVYLFCRSDDPVQVYDAEGAFVRTWGRGRFKTPHFARIDREGTLWLADCGRHVVERYTPEGELLLRLGTENEAGCDASHFDQPTDVAFGPTGDIFVSDGYGNSRIVRFDANGRFVKAWGSLGVGRGELSLPHTLGIDSTGRIYVGERNNVRVQVFDAEGNVLDEWRHVITPWGIFVTPADEVWVVGSSPMRWVPGEEQLGGPPKDQVFMRFDPAGRLRQLWTVPKGADGRERPGECNWAHGVAVDPTGTIYVGDIAGRRAQKFIRLEARA